MQVTLVKSKSKTALIWANCTCAHRLLPPFSADKQDMICKARKNLVLSICGLIKINENQGYHPCPSKCYPKKCRAEGVLW